MDEDLLLNCGNVKTLDRSFFNCYRILEIPQKFFWPCHECLNIDGCFANCRSILKYHGKMFKNMTKCTSCDFLFKCHAYKDAYPGNFMEEDSNQHIWEYLGIQPKWRMSTGANGVPFGYAYATSLVEEIPEDLLTGLENTTIINSMFAGWCYLKRLPENLFEGFTKVSHISGFVSGCDSLWEVPYHIFDPFAHMIGGDIANTFDWAGSMYADEIAIDRSAPNAPKIRSDKLSSCGGLHGTMPKIWDRTKFPNIITENKRLSVFNGTIVTADCRGLVASGRFSSYDFSRYPHNG